MNPAFAFLILVAQEPQGAASAVFERVQSLEAPFDVSEYAFADFDGDGRVEIAVVGLAGELRTFVDDPAAKGRFRAEPAGQAALADPTHTLLDLARIDERTRGMQLVALAPDGVTLFAPNAQGELVRVDNLAKRARFSLRVGRPTFADFASDINADGKPDFVVPANEHLEVWINQGVAHDGANPSKLASFKRTAAVSTEYTRWGARDSRELSDVLESSFAIPKLAVRDVNGDHKPDLFVSDGSIRAWHLQRADGTFPETPDVSVDLSLFRDTIDEAKVRPGHTLAVTDDPTMETRDLDGDGIPDYAIAHRRKVWVFMATANGPQFTAPSTIVKTADDITALALVDLDSDHRPDLLLIKVQVPTIAQIVRGVFGDWDVDIGATGYRNVDGKSFESSPSWKNQLEVRLPAILEVLKHPENFLRRFEQAAKRFRGGTIGDFDGDGKADVLLASEDKTRAELWRGRELEKDVDAKSTLDGALRRILFDDPNTTWDIERIALAFAGLAERRAAALTGGRPSDSSIALRNPSEFVLDALKSADLDGDGHAEVIAVYRRRDNSARYVFDLYRAR